LVFGGLGIGIVDGVGEWDSIAAALLADDPSKTTHPRGRSFRAFADQTRSDRRALAACITTSRELLTEDQVARITQPTLIAVGTKDDIGGSPEELAALMPRATAFHIEGRDHMLAVGDKSFKQRVLEFYAENPLE
jgi:pimeloyl-ACP methyl ester carboxylesterase